MQSQSTPVRQPRKPPVERICETCGRHFFVKASHAAKGAGRFCSIACRRAARPILLCKACGKPFTVEANIARKGRQYCSRSCYETTLVGAGNPAWTDTPDQVCLHCGKTFHIKPSRIANGYGRYCSKACAFAGRSSKVTFTCDTCGQTFERYPHKHAKGRGNFCSPECWYKFSRTIRGEERWTWTGQDVTCICAQCGVSFSVRPGRYKREKQRFCSHKCAGKSMGERFVGETHWLWKGGHRYPRMNAQNRTAYIEWRKAVYHRDNHTCQHCGKRGVKLNAHHILPWALYPERRYDVANGITLCKSCHINLHRTKSRQTNPLNIVQLKLFL